jgi:hypothetical protein
MTRSCMSTLDGTTSTAPDLSGIASALQVVEELRGSSLAPAVADDLSALLLLLLGSHVVTAVRAANLWDAAQSVLDADDPTARQRTLATAIAHMRGVERLAG